MVCGTKHCINKFQNMHFMICNDVIERVECYKYLGVWFDSLLKWDVNVTGICKKVSQRIGLVSRLRKFVPLKTTKLLATSLAIPYFDYCNLVWYNCVQCSKSKLQVLYNRLARVVLNEDPRTHISDMFNFLGWKTLDVRSNINTACMVFKCLKGDAPCYLQSNFSAVNMHHSYNTKSSVGGCLKQHKALTQAGQRTFHYRGVGTWNKLPPNLRSLNCTTNVFKSKISEYYSCT